jgi:hypothetical protein
MDTEVHLVSRPRKVKHENKDEFFSKHFFSVKMIRFFLTGVSFFLLTNAWAGLDAQIKLVNFLHQDELKIHRAVALIKKVVASQEFKERILNHSYRGKKVFVDNKGLSNEQIYHTIMNGVIDVELELYHQSNSTIGFTYPDTNRIWMNKKYFEKYTPLQVADNLTHEWLHKLGFEHEATYSQNRNYSVPYAVGYLMEELAAKYHTP